LLASIHSAFRQKPTERIIAAMNGIFQVALATETTIEINTQPMRLDLDDIHARRAAALGVKLVIVSN